MKHIRELPKPFPDPELYNSVIQAGFKNNPKRLNNYLRYKENKRKPDPNIDYLPIKLDIENVSRCNYRCTMCVVSDWPGGKRANDMPLEFYKKLINEQFGLIEIKIQGLGEPLMGKDYFEMISYAREKDIWVRAITNGSLLHLNDNYKRIIDSDVCELHVSIDGASAETYEKIRRGGNFERVKQNCIDLNSYASKQDKIRTRMWSVIQKDNFDELEELVKTAAAWGFRRLTMNLNLESWGHESWDKRNKQADMTDFFSQEHSNYLVGLGEELGIQVTFWATYEKFDRNDLDKICSWPFERAVVSSDMRIVPCCMVSEPAIADLGDANHFTENWNSPSYQRFRRAHLRGELPDICKKCYKSESSQEKDWAIGKPKDHIWEI